MTPERRFAAFVAAGGFAGFAVVLGGLLATGYDASAPCPDGWTIRPDRATPLGTSVRTCGPATPGRSPAKLHLVWTATGALDDARLDFVARANGYTGGAGIERVQDTGVEGAALAWERTGGALKSDVYFLSAGQRHGLLSVVFGPDSSWSTDDTVAPWLETVQGTAPWGAPVSPTLRASCKSSTAGCRRRPVSSLPTWCGWCRRCARSI